MTLGHRPHQRGLTPGALDRVDAGAGSEQGAHAVRGAGPGRGHHRGLALRQLYVRVRAGREQTLDHRRAAVLGREPQRGRAELVGRVDAGPCPYQQRGNALIVPECGPVQGGGAVGLTLVDVGALLQQAPDRLGVLRPGGGYEGKAGGVGAGREGRGNQSQTSSQHDEAADLHHRPICGAVRAHRESLLDQDRVMGLRCGNPSLCHRVMLPQVPSTVEPPSRIVRRAAPRRLPGTPAVLVSHTAHKPLAPCRPIDTHTESGNTIVSRRAGGNCQRRSLLSIRRWVGIS